VPPPRGRDRPPARPIATRRRAIRVTPITRRADREQAVAAPADFLAKRRVHDVGAASRSDWTRRSNRGTRETTGSVRRSIEAVTEGLEVSAPGPHLVRRSAQLTRLAGDRSIRRGCGRCRSYGRTERAHSSLENPQQDAGFPQASTATFSFQPEEQEPKTRTPTPRRPSRFTRFQVSADRRPQTRPVSAPTAPRHGRGGDVGDVGSRRVDLSPAPPHGGDRERVGAGLAAPRAA
jgi:hypothetical protein